MNRSELLGAIARGWCSPDNAGKEVDVVLAVAICDEVEALLASDKLPDA